MPTHTPNEAGLYFDASLTPTVVEKIHWTCVKYVESSRGSHVSIMASKITDISSVVCLIAWKHLSSTLLAFLWGESTDGRRIPHRMDQYCRKQFDVGTSVLYYVKQTSHACILWQNIFVPGTKRMICTHGHVVYNQSYAISPYRSLTWPRSYIMKWVMWFASGQY